MTAAGPASKAQLIIIGMRVFARALADLVAVGDAAEGERAADGA